MYRALALIAYEFTGPERVIICYIPAISGVLFHSIVAFEGGSLGLCVRGMVTVDTVLWLAMM